MRINVFRYTMYTARSQNTPSALDSHGYII